MDLTRARELLSGLADGINPLTGEIPPDDCVCNQAEIVRALNAVLTAIHASKANSLPLNAGRPWTAIEEDKLANEYPSKTAFCLDEACGSIAQGHSAVPEVGYSSDNAPAH